MRNTIRKLQSQKGKQPIVMVTAYDYPMARLVDEGVDAILVGDSLGMVVQGRDSTLPVTMDEIVYHTRMAGRGSQQAALLADLPFMSYQASVEDAVRNAGRLAKEAGAQAVKLEGGREFAEHIRAITASGLPVMGHLGLTPQSIHRFGGYGKQGKTEQAATRLLEDARIMEEAGMVMVVLENIPHQLARDITDALKVPTIGIGAGPHCDGQVQVLHDLLGLIPDFRPRHAVRYAEHGQSTREAISRYAEDVRSGNFVSE